MLAAGRSSCSRHRQVMAMAASNAVFFLSERQCMPADVVADKAFAQPASKLLVVFASDPGCCWCWVQIVAGWNGMAIQAFAQAAVVLGSEATPEPRAFPVEGCPPSEYLQAALQVAFACAYAPASSLSHTCLTLCCGNTLRNCFALCGHRARHLHLCGVVYALCLRAHFVTFSFCLAPSCCCLFALWSPCLICVSSLLMLRPPHHVPPCTILHPC